MSEAAGGGAAPEGEHRSLAPDLEVDRVADAYVQAALGDVGLALRRSVSDGLAASRLVSRGFARWGQPVRRGWPR